MRLPTVVYRYLLLFRSLNETQDGAGFGGVHLWSLGNQQRDGREGISRDHLSRWSRDCVS